MGDLGDFDSASWGTFSTRSENSSGPITLSDVFELGEHLEYLLNSARSRDEIGEASEESEDSHGILGGLATLVSILRSSNFDSSVTSDAIEVGIRLSKRYDSGDDISDEDAKELERQVVAWKYLLRSELDREQRIPVGDTGLLDVDGLLNSPEKLFDDHVWYWLDDRPKSDIQEACKTLCVDCSTSSVILSLRALEYCLRDWHKVVMEEDLDSSWGGVIGKLITEFLGENSSNDLMEQLSEVPPILSNLYYLKEKRNEVNHPERSPDSQEAIQTLVIVAGTITEIHHEIREKERDSMMQDLSHLDLSGLSDEDAVIRLIRELSDIGDTEDASLNDLRLVAEPEGIDPGELNNILESVMMSGRAYEPRAGHYKAI